MDNELYHHGILGQHWGKRNGPPYPLKGGDYSKSEITAIKRKRLNKNSIYNKKHFDNVIKENTELSTLSYDKDRTKKSDMFYATYKQLDKHQYNALFNRPIDEIIYDEEGNNIGTGAFLKYRINNRAKTDIKVASEDSGSDSFMDLYKNNRDFYNFVTDENRMESYFVKDKYKFKGYRESKEALDKVRSGNDVTSEDLNKVYRMFNYVIPYDGAGDKRKGKDAATQRAKFFNELKKKGYGAVLDTNDAIYGGFKATAPVIVFDTSKIEFSGAERTTTNSKKFSSMVLAGRKVLGI